MESMTQYELNEKLKQMSDVTDMGKGGKWRKHNLSDHICWWHRNGELLPGDATCEDNTLSEKYDNAVLAKVGVTPTLEDFKRLFDNCELIVVEGDSGLVLRSGDNYLYFKAGRYWTSSFMKTDIVPEGILPYSIPIDATFDIKILYKPKRLTQYRCGTSKLMNRPIVKQ